ncbi:MAG: 16S rRNA (guanine(527)-N(7))-methyltransferase RsmG [Cyanobacteriota bacterium]|nr:16S rRNA (guanine(527)-N(7))-methyltransferase RsmG [Cyanobacteriota bacterium]
MNQDRANGEKPNLNVQHSNRLLPEMEDIWLKTLKWQPDLQQQQRFQLLYDGILAGNQRLNLTRITDPMEFWEKHLWDSLAGAIHLDLAATGRSIAAIDIGTGGGFPGLPIAIAFPNYTMTLLDSTRKKTLFLDRLAKKLALSNVCTLTGRAEQLAEKPPHREAYDLATIRAVGTVSLCAKYVLPFLHVGGMAVLYRGQWTQEDLAELESVLVPLGGTIASIERFASPISRSIRHCIYLGKV